MKTAPAPRSSQQRRLPSILDRELRDYTKDAFGHRHFAKALEDLIEDEAKQPPFSIGLLGPWGTGKSTIKELYLEGLKSDKSRQDGKARSNRIFPITFNAWRHGGETDLKRVLLRTVFLALDGNEDKLNEKLFNQINETASQRRPIWDWFSETFGQMFLNMLVFVLLFGAIFCIVWYGLSSLELEQWPLLGVATGAFGLTGWLTRKLAAHLVDLRLRVPSLFQPRITIAFPSRTAEQYETLLLGQLCEFLKGRNKSVERLVIFVDDLDRLSAAEMVRGLDAIRNFMELPLQERLDRPIGVVFVISCDEDRVAEALRAKLSRIGPEEISDTVSTKTDARRYLDRLFQFRLEIPPFPKQDMRSFARKKLEEFDGTVGALEAKEVPIDTVIDTLIHVGVQSPRSAIHLLNAFLHSWWIAVSREKDGRGSQATGVLYEGAVTKHPVMLAALSVLKVDFPDFYDRVQARPELLDEFRQVIFSGMDLKALPPAARESMEPYLQVDDSGKLTASIRREYGPLRQYLASIDSLRRPKSLQPLLYLAVDPIARNFGDRAPDILNALVSGDEQGVLETLGRALDKEPLTKNEATLLRNLVERAMEDTEPRRINTARALAALAPRIPDSVRRSLLTSLARQMVALKEVRQHVGPKAASDIIVDLEEPDQRDVAGVFISDLMQGGAIDWEKAGGGVPNTDELAEIVQEAATLGIRVWRDHGLNARHETSLRTWLLDRTIGSGEDPIRLHFSYLNALVAEYSDTLLPALNPEYADQAIGVLQSETETIADPAGTLDRLASEFEHLAASGQEERSVLWQLLSRLISVRTKEATSLAWKTAGLHKDLTTAAQAMGFLAAFAARLKKDLEDDEKWGGVWPDGGNQFVDLLNNWRAHLTETSADPLLQVMTGWALTETRKDFAVKCLDILHAQSNPAWNKAIETILSVGLDEMTSEIGGYIGSRLADMTDANATTLRNHLNTIINNNDPDADHAAIYRAVLGAASPEVWQTEPWTTHLQQAVARCSKMYGRPDFIERILPAIAVLMPCTKQGSATNFLPALFADAAGHPDSYVRAHQAFHGHWPKISEQSGDYRPDEIAARACQFIRENATNADIAAVFLSLIELVEKDLFTEDTKNDIGAIIPLVWLTAPAAVSAHTAVVATMIRPAATVYLVTGAQPSDVDEAVLPTLLTAISGTYDHQRRVDTARALLDAQPVLLSGEPDGALVMWFAAMGEHMDAVARALFAGETLNDEQQVRVATLLPWDFWKAENFSLLGTLLTNSEAPETQAYMLSHLSPITNASKSGTARKNLITTLINTLPQLNVTQIDTVARKINSLQGQAALERTTEILEGLDEDQLDALLIVFPTSQPITGVKNAPEGA